MPKQAPFATIDDLHIGDIVWKSHVSMFTEMHELTVSPYTVVDINKSSFYVVPEDKPDYSPTRHVLKTGQEAGRQSFGFHTSTFRTKADFDSYKAGIVRKAQLKERLVNQVERMSLAALEDLNEHLNH